jgi:hypothetical protein
MVKSAPLLKVDPPLSYCQKVMLHVSKIAKPANPAFGTAGNCAHRRMHIWRARQGSLAERSSIQKVESTKFHFGSSRPGEINNHGEAPPVHPTGINIDTKASRSTFSERALPFRRHATTAIAGWAFGVAWQGSLTEQASTKIEKG